MQLPSHLWEQLSLQPPPHAYSHSLHPFTVVEELPLQLIWQSVLQLRLQPFEHPFVQSSLQAEQKPIFRLLAWLMIGAFVKAIKPRIGKAFLAASLKNSLLFWVSLFLLFSIVYVPRLLPIMARRG